MNTNGKYKTKQRERLLIYLKTMAGAHITVNDVCEHFQEIGEPIGQTTIYRQMERLVDEGVVNKYIIDGNSPACFEYIEPKEHVEMEGCFHCKCEKCGKLIHLHCDEMAQMQRHLGIEHQFVLDPKRTVLYGLCEECRK